MQRRVPIPTLAWTFAPYIVVSVAHVIFLTTGSPLSGPTKIALMPLLALPVIALAGRVAPRGALVLILVALLFSWLGDSVGAFFPTAPELPLMLGFFGIAHLAYIALFARYLARRRLPWWALVFAAWWLGMVLVLGPHTGDLLIAVAVYGIVLGATAAFSTRCHPAVMVGGIFFLVSDTILAFRLFLPDAVSPWGSPVIMLTYTLGQGLIVAGALLALTRKRVS